MGSPFLIRLSSSLSLCGQNDFLGLLIDINGELCPDVMRTVRKKMSARTRPRRAVPSVSSMASWKNATMYQSPLGSPPSPLACRALSASCGTPDIRSGAVRRMAFMSHSRATILVAGISIVRIPRTISWTMTVSVSGPRSGPPFRTLRAAVSTSSFLQAPH